MAEELTNTGVAELLVGVQASLGTAAAAPRKALPLVSGSLSPAQTQGEQKYFDGVVFGRADAAVTKVEAGGELTFVGKAESLAYLFSLALANDSVTGLGPYAHVTDSNSNGLKAFTVWQSVGVGALAVKQKFTDCVIKSASFEGSASSEGSVTAKVEVIALKVETYDTVAAATDILEDTSSAFFWPHGSGSFVLGADTVRGDSQLMLKIDTGLEVVHADNHEAHGFKRSKSASGITGTASIFLDAIGLAIHNTAFYGSATPAAGTSPTTAVQELSMAFEFAFGAGADERSVKFELGASQINIDKSVEPSMDGEASVEVAFKCQKSADGSPALTVTSLTPNTLAY